MKTIIITLLTFILFSRCQKSVKTNYELREDSIANEKKETIQTVNFLATKIENSIWIDTFKYKYSYQVQDILKDKDNIILHKFSISDVSRENEYYFTLHLYDKIQLDLECLEDEKSMILKFKKAKKSFFIIAAIDTAKWMDASSKLLSTGKVIGIYSDNSFQTIHAANDPLGILPSPFEFR